MHSRGRNFPRQGKGKKGFYPSILVFFPFPLNLPRQEGPSEENKGIFPHLKRRFRSFLGGLVLSNSWKREKNPGEALYPEKCEEQGMVSPVWKQLFHLYSLFQGQIPDKKPFPLLFPRISITSGAPSIPFPAGFWGQLERTNKISLCLFVSYKQRK